MQLVNSSTSETIVSCVSGWLRTSSILPWGDSHATTCVRWIKQPKSDGRWGRLGVNAPVTRNLPLFLLFLDTPGAGVEYEFFSARLAKSNFLGSPGRLLENLGFPFNSEGNAIPHPASRPAVVKGFGANIGQTGKHSAGAVNGILIRRVP